ncbi:MAG: N-6 DNA methylase [Actinomyces sp.]|uniref:Eco57I restriction-modification methylase domain-containing protein n=1 Tax=Actinomyces sp. TaxID=29317 RepID=UPI0026DB5D58|nr:DNA methyltransferase [Actinomyces sp.]MDO4243591.1 N-6 DNA methylase [Actinomyces sp.]
MSPRKASGARAAGSRAGRSSASGRAARTAAQQHRAWLELVDVDGPFLSVPVMTRLHPQGMPSLGAAGREALRAAKPAFDRAWDAWDRDRDSNGDRNSDRALDAYRRARDTWVLTVLTAVFGWGRDYVSAQDRPALAEVHRVVSDGFPQVTVTPTGALVHRQTTGALVLVTDPVDSLRGAGQDGWAASPVDRMAAMLRSRDSECTIGLVTDGRWWALVSAPPGGTTACGIVDCLTWVEEPATRDAFCELLGLRRLLGGTSEDRLPALFQRSVLAAEEVTEALGAQVRRAVELVVMALSEAALDSQPDPALGDPLPEDTHEVYEAVVTVMMRAVFLLFAEERGLLPAHTLYTGGYGLVGVLDDLEARARDEGEESMDGTSLTWHRLLATSRALHEGVNNENMRIPAYGGSLFDPARFPVLTAVDARGSLRLAVSDRVMLHVLRSLQTARTGQGQDVRRLSFRDIDVEQIGYIYEGLLGYTCVRTSETVLGLHGTEGAEPEVSLALLEDLAEEHDDDVDLAQAVLAWLREHQSAAKPPTKGALAKAFRSGDMMDPAERERALRAVTKDDSLREALKPWIGAVRWDLRGRPVVIESGGLVVTETPSRRNAGAHYTPRSLAEEVVRHALEPLVYNPGPRETDDRTAWRPLSSDAILGLHVADIACGSGAFLVAAARFLADHLVEAWTREGALGGYAGQPGGLRSHALRQVVARCLYGVDINEMAVEMCKLSLWLVSLDKDKPFSFVDNKIFVGNSLLGLSDVRQLRAQHIDPAAAPEKRLFELDRTGKEAAALDIDAVLSKVRRRRLALATEVDDTDPARSTTTKQRLQRGNEADLRLLEGVADAVVAVGLDPAVGAKPGKKLNEAYGDLAVALGRAFPPEGEGDEAMLEAILNRGLTPTVETDYERWHCLHWPLAVPEVMECGGFDAIVGNPPFLGGQKLTGSQGANVRDWFVHVLAGGTKGSADLVAYFFLRAFSLLRPTGMLGLIATNTLAQGGARKVGLDRITANGFEITRAIRSRPWSHRRSHRPRVKRSGDQPHLEYAVVWGSRGYVADEVPRVCDDTPVARISALLEPEGSVTGNPKRLVENAGIAFQGCIVLGTGFILDPEEARSWIEQDPRNVEVLFPYLNGKDLNSRPDCSPSRWVIDFGMRSRDDAGSYFAPFWRVKQYVKPQRDLVKIDYRREYWWRFAAWAPSMRRAIAELDEVLVIARVSKTVMPVRVPAGQV